MSDKNISVRRCCTDTHSHGHFTQRAGLGESCLDHVSSPSEHVVDARLWCRLSPGHRGGHRKHAQKVEILYISVHKWKLFVHLRIFCIRWVRPLSFNSHYMAQDHKTVQDREHKCQIILKKNLNYVPCKMDSKSIQSISSNNATRWLTPAAITHTWPPKLHPQKGCCFTDCLQILSSRKDISETRACQALYLFVKYAPGLAYSQDGCNWEICSCRH